MQLSTCQQVDPGSAEMPCLPLVLDTSDAKALQILLMHVDGQAQSRTAGQLSNQKGPCRGCSVQELDIERIGAFSAG